MTEDKTEKQKKLARKKVETFRERVVRTQSPQQHRTAKLIKPLSRFRRKPRVASDKPTRLVRLRRRLIPRYFREAWLEIKQVQWPTKRETLRLSFAVFAFALGFSIVVGILDFGLEKIFREVFINS